MEGTWAQLTAGVRRYWRSTHITVGSVASFAMAEERRKGCCVEPRSMRSRRCSGVTDSSASTCSFLRISGGTRAGMQTPAPASV